MEGAEISYSNKKIPKKSWKAQQAHVVHSDNPTYEEAMEGPYRKELLEAMEKERQQLQRYNVYEVSYRHPRT
jgi:hypothetical protein